MDFKDADKYITEAGGVVGGATPQKYIAKLFSCCSTPNTITCLDLMVKI